MTSIFSFLSYQIQKYPIISSSKSIGPRHSSTIGTMPEQIFLSTIRLFLSTLHSINHQFTCLLVSITLPNFYSFLTQWPRIHSPNAYFFGHENSKPQTTISNKSKKIKRRKINNNNNKPVQSFRLFRLHAICWPKR